MSCIKSALFSGCELEFPSSLKHIVGQDLLRAQLLLKSYTRIVFGF